MSEEKKYAPHIEKINKALEGKLSEELIEEELKSYVDIYGVPIDKSVRAIIKKHEGNIDSLYQSGEMNIEDLTGNEKGLSLKARVVSLNDRTIDTDDGKKNIQYGILGDETGTVPFTLWDPEKIDLEEEDTVLIENAYSSIFNDRPQVQISTKTEVKHIDGEEVPEYVKEFNKLRIDEILPDMYDIEVTGRILSLEERTITRSDNGEDADLWSGIIADETGKVQFSAWEDFGIEEGDVLKIKGAYSREYRGFPQLSFGDTTDVEKLDDDVLPPKDELYAISSKVESIGDLAKRGGAVDVKVEGTMVDIKDRSGLIFRCPECNRVLQEQECRVHGTVEGQTDLRVKCVLDDDTGALTVIMGKELTEDLLGYGIEKALEKARDAMSHTIIQRDVEEVMLAQQLSVRGNVSTNEYGMMLIANGVEKLDMDVQAEARIMLEEIEEQEW